MLARCCLVSDIKATIHSSKHDFYVVESLPDAHKDNYAVTNVQQGKQEYVCESLPQAIGVAEQFDHLLHTQVWLEMFPDDGDSPVLASVPDLPRH